MSNQILVVENVPLHQRKASEFKSYEWKAITTLGSVDDYKHFLPRLLELCAEQHRRDVLFWGTRTADDWSPGLDLYMMSMKLEYAGARTWPEAERAALRAVGVAMWWWQLSLRGQFHGGVGHALAFIAAIGGPWAGLLNESLQKAEGEELAAFSQFIYGTITLSNKGPGTIYNRIGNDPASADEFEQWILNPDVEKALEGAIFRSTDPAIAQEISLAVQHLQWLKTSRK